MTISGKRVAAAAAIAAGLGVTACGSAPVTPLTAAPASTGRIASHAAEAPAPVVNYGAQYLADVAPSNADAAAITSSDSFTSPAVVKLAADTRSMDSLMLRQSWPASVRPDVKILLVDDGILVADIVTDNASGKFASDVATANAQANFIRAELGLKPTS